MGSERARARDEVAGLSPADRLYEAFWLVLAPYLTSAREESEILAYLEGSLQVGQIRKWLKRACEEGRAERLTGPVRYRALEPAPREPESSDATTQQQPRLID